MQKKFLAILTFCALALSFCGLTSCMDDEDPTWTKYKDWREYNQSWLMEQTARSNADGTPYYARCIMPTDPQAYVLMHIIGEEHTQNLKPQFTSSTKVNYTLRLANDSIVDSGANFTSQLSSTGLITGWSLAVMQLHVGDSAQFVIPYNIAYGTSESSAIKPYSNLQFNIRLVDIVNYETRP